MKEIQLTQGYVAIVDDEDFERLDEYKWYVCKGKNTFYAARNKRGGRKNRGCILMHREILGAVSGGIIDHRDDNGLNNQKNNLRICTTQQNISNKRKELNYSSRFKGVHWLKANKKWRAALMFKYKHIHLGLFDSEESAAHAYDRGALKFFGTFARLNFK
ncbi:MAG: HNH endonuclease [Proteobacteria bacterium]|nr:HNH endonuclease [Pseudomonadota bacterium]